MGRDTILSYQPEVGLWQLLRKEKRQNN